MTGTKGWHFRVLENLSRRRSGTWQERIRRGWALATVYVALSTAFCLPLFAHPLANGSGDWDQHIFYYAAVLRSAAFGDLPFWNPWYCGGNVLWANPQVSLVSPVYLLALVMPLTLAMKVNILAHYLVGCCGMHLVVRRIIGVKGTAVTVFLVSLFVFSGAIAMHLRSGHTNYLPVLLLPLVVYCFWQATAGMTRSVLLGGAILGFSILNGGMHVAPLAAVLLGVLGLGALVFGRTLRPLVLAGAMFALGCGYAAPRIVPTMAFIRSADFHDTRPVKEPDFMSLDMLRTAFWDGSQRTLRGKVTPGIQLYGWQEYGNYMGWFGATLALASAGWILVFRRRREHWRESSVAFALVVVAFLTAGEFASHAPAKLLRHLPLFSSFRIPSRHTMLAPLLGAMCVAFAARALEATRFGSRWRWPIGIVCVIGVCQLGFVNRQLFQDIFVLSADTQRRLFERTTPTIAPEEVVTPGGPRVHRSFMLDSMMADVSPLHCYEPLRLTQVAQPGPVAIQAEGRANFFRPTFSPNRVATRVIVGRDPVRMVLNQNFAAGWTTNVGPVEHDPVSKRPSVMLPAWYAGPIAFTYIPPGLWIGLVICAITVSLSVVIWRASAPPGPTGPAIVKETRAPLSTYLRAAPRTWLATLVLVALYLASGWPTGAAGLVRTVVANTSRQTPSDVRRVATIDVAGLSAWTGEPTGGTVNWRGAWYVTSTGLYDLVLSSRGRSSWTIDGHLANQVTSTGDTTRTVYLDAGWHALEISYVFVDEGPDILVAATRTGGRPEPLAPGTLNAQMPRHPRLLAWIRSLHGVVGWLALAALVWALRTTIGIRRGQWREWLGRRSAELPGDGEGRARRNAWLVRSLAWSALAVILAHGALLRLDAITGQYGPVSSPRWLAALQTREFADPERIRPASIRWEPEQPYPHRDGPPTLYRSDPYTYLDAARKMTSFYTAHWREPVFPFVTRVFLGLLHDQDVAVSFASAFCSILAIWFTYLLGAAAWSRPVGLLAALGLSLDNDVLTLASRGWRDDAYVAAVALCAFLMLRCWRIGQAPVRVRRLGRMRLDSLYVAAASLGVASGFAVLTRIMAVPFLAAGVAFLVLGLCTSWRRRLAMAGIGISTALIVAGPYFVNCWRVHGDPLYTFNVHGNIYSVQRGEREWQGSTAGYIAQRIAEQPIEALDTIVQGVTTYPFTNKWHGLDFWCSGLADWAPVAAIVGLAVLAAFASGRLLLIATWASLLPFSFTWTSDPDFRFTVHVYPALLIAGAIGVAAVLRAARAAMLPAVETEKRSASGGWPLGWAGLVGPAVVMLWFVFRVSPPWMFAETLRAGESASVTAGVRDGAFFGPAWSEVTGKGNVLMRVATTDGAISFRLPSVEDYPVTLRMDPFPRPLDETPGRLPVVDVAINGTPLQALTLDWDPARVGTYTFMLPRTAVRRGLNRLVLRMRRADPVGAPRISPGLSDGDAIGLWYVRVQPAGTK